MLRFNLKALLRRMRPGMRRKSITFRDIAPPQVKVDALNAIIQRVVVAWWNGCRDQIMPAYVRELASAKAREASSLVLDDVTDIRGESDSVAISIDRIIDNLLPDLRAWAAAYETFHRARWGSALTPTGVQLGTLLGPVDVAETVEATVQANVSLIRSVSSDTRTRIEGIVFRGFTARAPANEIAKEIADAVGMSRARARRIASDQTVKLSAQLDTERMRQAGIDEFTWIHSGKVHARKWHLARNGKRFHLEGDIPPDDMPGIPIFCGCRKRAELPLD